MRSAAAPRWFAAGLVLVALSTVAATFALPSAFRALPLLAPDSVSYLEWSPGRTPAYPAFLSFIRSFSSDLDALGSVQLAIFLSSAAFCAAAFQRVYRDPFIALVFAAAVMMNPQLVSYAFAAQPELLFSSTLLLHFGCVILAVNSSRPTPYVLAGSTLALLILLKPSGYALVVCLPALAIAARVRSWRAVLAAALPLAVILVLVAFANFLRYGFFATQAQGGYSLIAHVAPFVDSAPNGEDAAVTRAIAADIAPQRDALSRAMPLDLYYLLSSHEYHAGERIVRRRIVEDVERRLGTTIADQRQFPSDPVVLREITTTGSRLARRAILNHPRGYARHVAAQLYGLWLLPLIQPHDAVARLTTELDALRRAIPGLGHDSVAFRAVPAVVFVGIRALLFAVLAGSIVAVALMLLWRAPLTVPIAYAALALHANYLLVAAVQPGLPRYALVMWPAGVLVLAGCASLIIERVLKRPAGPRQRLK
jgi:hypothetical protein